MRARSRLPYVALFCAAAPALSLACAADAGDDPKGPSVDDDAPSARPPSAAASPSPTASGAPTAAPRDSGAPAPPTSADAGAVDAATRDAALVDVGAGTPDVGAPVSCPSCTLRVRYRAAGNAATSNELKPHYDVVNAGSAPQPLSELTLRYWFTVDGDRSQSYVCDYAAVGCANVRGTVQKLAPARAMADAYLEVSFTAAAGSIAPGGATADIQSRIHKDDYSNYDQSNDYSFNAAYGQFADWGRVTLYRAGQLVWGTEPP